MMSFNTLIELDGGKGYFTGPSIFRRGLFFDSSLMYIRNEFEFWIIKYVIIESRRQIVMLASTSRGPLLEVDDYSLICCDYRGTTLWVVPIIGIRERTCQIRANGERVLVYCEDEASRPRLIVADGNGRIDHNIILTYKPEAISNIINDQFLMLYRDRGHLLIDKCSATTCRSRTFRLNGACVLGEKASYAITYFKDEKLLVSAMEPGNWQYAYYRRINRRHRSVTIAQKSNPIVLIDENRILIFKQGETSVSLLAF